MNKWMIALAIAFISFMSHAKPLPIEEAFRIHAQRIDPNALSISWELKPGYFLYKNRIRLTAPRDNRIHIGQINFPRASIKKDKTGKTYPIYRNKLLLHVPILGKQPGETLLTVYFQGCADDGFCYPPQTQQLMLAIDKQLDLTQVSLDNTSTHTSKPSSGKDDDFESIYTQNNWIMVIFTFFGFGLLLAFTPCVLPMIPVLSGIIIGHGEQISTRKAFFLSLSYVLSMALTYALFGALVASVGKNLQVTMQSPFAIASLGLLFILLAFSTFGYYDLRLPTSWQAKLANLRQRQSTGHYLGAAIMGSLSTLILSPCVTAPLIGALSYIAHSGNILFGTLTLFFLGLGMGTPLLIIGASAGKLLPQAGVWMNTVKAFFGFLLLATAIYLFDRILPNFITMVLWASLFIYVGLYCDALNAPSSNLAKFRQGLGIMSLVYGLLILIGASMGSDNPIQPLTNLQTLISQTKGFSSQAVKTIDEANQAILNAKGHPLLLDFYADWCASCKINESTLHNDPKLKALLNRFVILKADVTRNDEGSQALLKKYGVIAPPTVLFFNKEGKEVSHLRLIGEASASTFLNHLTELD